MNKKAIDYSVLLLLVVFIGTLYLGINISNAYSAIDKQIGETQAEVLNLNTNIRLYEAYLKQITPIAMTEALEELKNPREQGLMEPAGNCAYVNLPNTPKELVPAFDLQTQFTRLFNMRMNEHLKDLPATIKTPENNFELYSTYSNELRSSAITLAGIQPTIFLLQNGEAGYTPYLTVPIHYTLANEPLYCDDTAAMLRLVIDKCLNSPNPDACATELIQQYRRDEQWTVGKHEQDLLITSPFKTCSCYAIHLPTSAPKSL